MEKQKKQGERHNAELVDALFEMMFETLWTSPSTRWRNVEAFRAFEDCARRVVVLISSTDLATADAERLAQMRKAAGELSESVAGLARNKLILRASEVKVAEVMRRLEQAISESVSGCAAETPNR